jgi:hypothetical protein
VLISMITVRQVELLTTNARVRISAGVFLAHLVGGLRGQPETHRALEGSAGAPLYAAFIFLPLVAEEHCRTIYVH